MVGFVVLTGLSAGTGKLCIFGHFRLVFIWSCFVSCVLFRLFYVILRNLCSGTHRRNRFNSQGRARDILINPLTRPPETSVCLVQTSDVITFG